MDLSTVDRVKQIGAAKYGDANDAVLQSLVSAYSSEFETYLGRYTQVATRTEVIRLRRAQKTLLVKATPIASVTSVKYWVSRDFSAVVNLFLHYDYTYDADLGVFEFYGETRYNPGFVQIVYSGGMAADQASFTTAFPAISAALDMQVLEHLHRVRNGSASGNVTVGNAATSAQDELKLMKRVTEVLDKYKVFRA